MKKLIYILVLLSWNCLWAQENKKVENKEADFVPVIVKKAEFSGGNEAFLKYISDSLRYPFEAEVNGIQGKIYVSFDVAKDGSIEKVAIERGIDSLLNLEALRLISNMPKWNPASQAGFPVKTRIAVPIIFTIPKMETKSDTPNIEPNSKNNKTIFITEVLPEYPGGPTALKRDIANIIRYPRDAQIKRIQGKVIVQATIDTDGSVTDVKIARGVHYLLDKEAIRVVQSLPKFIPGTQDGKPVKVNYGFPINFELR